MYIANTTILKLGTQELPKMLTFIFITAKQKQLFP